MFYISFYVLVAVFLCAVTDITLDIRRNFL